MRHPRHLPPPRHPQRHNADDGAPVGGSVRRIDKPICRPVDDFARLNR